TFQVAVRNQGSANAGAFVVRLQGVGPSQDQSVASLAAGATVTRTFTLPLSTSPETFTATADVFNQVNEANEANNTRQVSVSGVAPLPDLVIQDVQYAPSAPTIGTTITFQITVANAGGSSAGAFYVRLTGASGYRNAFISGLGAGMSHTVALQLPLSTSPETFTVVADVLGQVAESDEGNNTRQVTITAAAPPLSFTVALDRSSYTVGDPVRVMVSLSRASYVYLVELDAAGRAVLIFPNLWEQNPGLPSGTTQLPRGAYTITATEPAGAERLFGFAADRAIPYFPTSFGTGFPVLSTNGANFLAQVRNWLSANVPAGSWAEASASYTVQPQANLPPQASFTFSPSNPLVNQWITFDGRASTDPDGTIVGYSWNFGDGATGTGAQVQKRYSSAGTYTVALTVTDNRGATGTTTRTVTVTAPNQPPTASFVFSPTNPDPGVSVTFNGTASSDPDGTIVSYAWNFGDGGTASGPTVSHAYGAAGAYTVTLTVTDNLGATGTKTQTIQVGPPPILPGMPTIDRPGIYVWGDPDDHWHITVAGDPSWPSPKRFQVSLTTTSRGQFRDFRMTPAGTTPSAGQQVTWEGTVWAGWVDLRFTLTGATSMSLSLYLDTDGDGVPKPARPEDAVRLVFLRACKTNPPGVPFGISVPVNLGALRPSHNFSVTYVPPGVDPRERPDEVVSWYIEDKERQAGCR
ncbi:PKD domain-containing protein, partial [Candidatus Bipolaricaulota bacterium]|nr:PKD domain-containing protein [Candidatus Bipolaricaulota bacterium]